MRYQSCRLLSSTVGSARDLGVVIDSRLSMADHLASVCRSAYIDRCMLSRLDPHMQSLSRDVAKTSVQAFISSRLDYCNSVLYGVTARLITRTGRREHISPVLQELHWRPVRRRVDFKLATLMLKSLHGCAPSYLSDACKSALEASHRLRSSGDRSFDVAGPRLWNKLSASLRSSDGLCQSRRQLKTFLFVKD